MGKPLDLVGDEFGRLTAVAKSASRRGHRHWHCLCRCGWGKEVQGGHLTSGRVRSCGCLRTEANRSRATHGETGTPLYRAWLDMRWRCSPNAVEHRPYYHDRGVTVCERWATSYQSFRDDVGPHPGKGWTLDRSDNGRGYEPGNCRWATWSQQNGNRRGWAGRARAKRLRPRKSRSARGISWTGRLARRGGWRNQAPVGAVNSTPGQ